MYARIRYFLHFHTNFQRITPASGERVKVLVFKKKLVDSILAKALARTLITNQQGGTLPFAKDLKVVARTPQLLEMQFMNSRACIEGFNLADTVKYID